MLVDIPYNGETIKADFPDDTDLLLRRDSPVLSDSEIYEKLAADLESYIPRFKGKNPTIVINDATRRIPTEKILKILLDLLSSRNIRILIATGTHNKSTEEDKKSILGDLYDRLGRSTESHDHLDENNIEYLGSTSRGTAVKINKRFLESEAAITINSVEPHFFAGFTGGRKSIIPGLAALDTVIQNHSLAKSENAASFRLDDNPVHLDLEEALRMIPDIPLFSVQMVNTKDNGIVDLFSGEISTSFYRACQVAREEFSVPIRKCYDIVFSVAEPPLDCNLYQLQKAQEHGAEAVADGGILIVAGACAEGIGSPYFMRLADDYPSPEDALSERAMMDNRFGIHKLVKTARRLKKIKVWYVTKLDDNEVRKVYFEPLSSPRQALRQALEYFGGRASVAILHDACYLVPRMIDVKGGV